MFGDVSFMFFYSKSYGTETTPQKVKVRSSLRIVSTIMTKSLYHIEDSIAAEHGANMLPD